MPRGDGTGPMSLGPITGRGIGYCAGLTALPMCKHGFRGRYYSAGMLKWTRFGYMGTSGLDEQIPDERESLNKQVEFLENQLQHLKKRLENYKDVDAK